MGKLDDLLKSGGTNIAESMGAGLERGDKSAQTSTMPARWQGVAKSKNAIEVPLDKIVPNPDQPREEFEPESLERLADSLRTRGQLQPIRCAGTRPRASTPSSVGNAAGVRPRSRAWLPCPASSPRNPSTRASFSPSSL